MEILMNAEHLLNEDYMGYSYYALHHRAISRLEDGLKPVHRRVLETMLELPNGFNKSQNIEGAVMTLHPHGGTYGTMVKMIQKDFHNIPLLTGKGNFGSHAARDLAPAAPRYSEIKLSDFGKEILKDVNKSYVSKRPTYDGKKVECDVLPVKIPLALIQYSYGVAVGYSTSVLPLNLNELCKAMVKYINTNEKTYLYPDFASKGKLLKNEESLKEFNEDGSGTFFLRGNASIEGNRIIIDEIPFSTTSEAIVEKVIDLVDNGKLTEVVDALDLTGFNKKTKNMEVRIEIVCKKNIDMNVLLNKLYLKTPLQHSVSANMNFLFNKSLSKHGVWSVIENWLNWRRGQIKLELKHDIIDLETKSELLFGLSKVKDIEEALKIVRFSEDPINELIKIYDLNLNQASYVSKLQARLFTNKWFSNEIEKLNPTLEKIKELKLNQENESYLNNRIIIDLEYYNKKFSHNRRTEIIENSKIVIPKDKKEIEIENSDYLITITTGNYIYKTKGEKDIFLKPGDSIKYQLTMNNLDIIAAFDKNSNNGGRIKIKDILIHSKSDLGVFANQIIDFEIKDLVPILDGYYVLILYTNGRIAKLTHKAYQGTTKKITTQGNKDLTIFEVIALPDNLDKTLHLEYDKGSKDLQLIKFMTKKCRGTQGILPAKKDKLISYNIK